MQDLANAVERAIAYRIGQANQTHALNVYTGQGDYDKANPSIVIYAESGTENPLNSGNFTLSVQCELRSTAETQELAEWRTLCRDIMGILMADDLASKLSEEADDLHVFGISGRQIRSGTEENQWLSTLSLDAYCCLSDMG